MDPQHKKHPELDLFTLSWPIFVEMGLGLLLGTITLWMASRFSAGAVAVLGMSNQLRTVFDRVFRVVSMGSSVVVTQHRGAGDDAGARQVALAGFSAALWLGAAVALLVGVWPQGLLRLLRLPPELMDTAVPFLRVVAVAQMVEAINITMFAVLRAFTYTRDAMRMVMAMNLLHLAVSAALAFGVGPLPALGVWGLAWGLLASRLLVFALLLARWSARLAVRPALRHVLHVAGEPFRAILQVGLPSAGEKIGFRLCFMATVAMTGSLGTVALATQVYAMHVNAIVILVAGAAAAGIELVIGHHVGAGRLREAHALLLRGVRICLLASGICGLLAWLIMPHAIRLIAEDPAVPVLLATVLAIELLAGLGRSANVLFGGALRAAGDARFPARVSIYFNLLLGTGLAWLLGIRLGLGLPGIWLGYMADECARGLVMAVRWFRHGWLPPARQARRRVLGRRRAVPA